MPAQLTWPVEPDEPSAVVLVLHGGRDRSQAPVREWQTAVLRMRPFAGAIADASDGRIAVAAIRYAVRGWNGAAASPLRDTELALEQVTGRHPDLPLGLLGHSMGGRVALQLGGDERVHAIAALAPWVEPQDPVRSHPGLHVLIRHGTRDRMTSPKRSKAYAEALAARGVDVTYESVGGGDHAMLRQASQWHQRTADYLVRQLLTD